MNPLRKLSIYRYIIYFSLAVLFLCGLTHILSSCSDDFVSRWNHLYGKEVTVKVSVGIIGFGESIDVTRSAGVPTPLTAAAPLGDGLMLQAILEPDTAQSRTRAGLLIPFPEDTHIRVVAYPLGSTTPAGHAFVDADGIELAANDTVRLATGDYRFVAYAYYHPDYRDVPDGYETPIENKVPDIVVAFPPEKDLLYGSTIKYVGPDSLAEIDVVHLYSRITRVEANTLQMGSGYPVQTISNVEINNYNGNLHLAKDSLSRGAAAPHSISNSLWSSVPAVTCSAIDTFLVYPAGGTVVRVGTIQVDGRTFHNVSTTFNTELERGVSYTLKLNVKSDTLPEVDVPIGDFPYVGAFWRAQEKGERVIRIPAAGLSPQDTAWTATVWHDLSRWTPGSDGVVLAMGDSPDPNIRQSGFNPNAEDYPVSPGSTTINGVISGGYITFRIGLQQYLPSVTSPPRYAVVLIYFGPNKSNVQRIFLRQGEEPDYLMRPGDTDGSGAAVADGRSYAQKFSPYNLRDPGNNTAGSYSSVPDLGYRGGTPVGFPSQAGYFFHWNVNTKAFHPTDPLTFSWNSSISGTGPGALYWDHNVHEVCPPNYRRPQDGISQNTTGPVAGSEIRQSLWLNPVAGGSWSSGRVGNTDNTIFGYYADGFFDRREIENPAGVSGPGSTPRPNSAVSAATNQAAYNGRLFFNPYNNASLFFPVSGYREANQGALWNTGTSAYYWTTSSEDAAYAWTFSVGSGSGYTGASLGSIDRAAGFSVRCIAEPTPWLNVSTNSILFAQCASGSGDAQSVTVSSNIPGFSFTHLNPTYFTVSRSNNTLTVTPLNPGSCCAPSSDIITVTAGGLTETITVKQDPRQWRYDFTGVTEEFTPICGGTYQIELWGSQGRGVSTFIGGGGYVKGELYLTVGEVLYVNVGGQGSTTIGPNNIVPGGWNGGGNAWGYPLDGNHGSGGGATDIRFGGNTTVNRIMVAGAGGGLVGVQFADIDSVAAGGGLRGGTGTLWYGVMPNGQPGWTRYEATGGTQTAGGSGLAGGASGGLGQGGNGGTASSGVHPVNTTVSHRSGGGGGYYGGGVHYLIAGGGSSFISGHNGCNAVDAVGNHTSNANHFSNKIFTNTVMIDGEGRVWTNVLLGIDPAKPMPNPAGGFYGTGVGRNGSGYAIITYLGP